MSYLYLMRTRLRELEERATAGMRIYRPAPTEERPVDYEREERGLIHTQLLAAGGAAASVGGQDMADAETVNTLRGEAAFIIPEEFKRFLPLILLFLLFVLVVLKK